MLENVEIIVGTYEEFTLGYRVKTVGNSYEMVKTFANHDHSASVRCVASNGNFLATGGADDTIVVYNMLSRKKCSVFRQHYGTVNCVTFTPNQSHIISAGEDGALAIFKVGSFMLEKLWGSAHKGSGILGISVHPSGKMALSVGGDGTLRTWNLVKGRQAYATNLGSKKSGIGWQLVGVQWSPDGKLYAVGIGTKINIYNVETAGIVCSAATEIKICCFSFLGNEFIAVGCDDGKIFIFSLKEQSCIVTEQAHELRVKCMSSVLESDQIYIVSASSSGEIKVWKIMGNCMAEVMKSYTGCRITCLTIATCGYSGCIKQEDVSGKDMLETDCPAANSHRLSQMPYEDCNGEDSNEEISVCETAVGTPENSGNSKRKKQIEKRKGKLCFNKSDNTPHTVIPTKKLMGSNKTKIKRKELSDDDDNEYDDNADRIVPVKKHSDSSKRKQISSGILVTDREDKVPMELPWKVEEHDVKSFALKGKRKMKNRRLGK